MGRKTYIASRSFGNCGYANRRYASLMKAIVWTVVLFFACIITVRAANRSSAKRPAAKRAAAYEIPEPPAGSASHNTEKLLNEQVINLYQEEDKDPKNARSIADDVISPYVDNGMTREQAETRIMRDFNECVRYRMEHGNASGGAATEQQAGRACKTETQDELKFWESQGYSTKEAAQLSAHVENPEDDPDSGTYNHFAFGLNSDGNSGEPKGDLPEKFKGDGKLGITSQTGKFDSEYRDGSGAVKPEALNQLKDVFADKRTGQKMDVPAKLVEILGSIDKRFGHKGINMVSGYRSPSSNAKVGGAGQSLHMKGWAADIAIKGVDSSEVQKYALEMQAGGVGSYSGFTHVDVGNVRSWGTGSGKDQSSTNRKRRK